jgi:hypothetical protein
MTPHFVFPADPLNARMIDPEFQDQAIALKQAGFGTSVLNHEARKLQPAVPEGTTVVYRGWMMTEPEYAFLYGALSAFNVIPLTNIEQYTAAHHLPKWYPLVERYTPRTEVFPLSDDMAERIKTHVALGGTFQLKDYVKSLKTAGGSKVASADEVVEVLQNMEKYRGSIEGGICVREWEELLSYSEKRYFVVNGKYHGQEMSFDIRHMGVLDAVSRVIPSPFYSVDIALDFNGRARLVEIGDGQVSDLVGWTPERFAQIWQ